MSRHVRAGALLRREISFIFDAVIYMLTFRDVKRQLIRKFHALGCCCTDDGVVGDAENFFQLLEY